MLQRNPLCVCVCVRGAGVKLQVKENERLSSPFKTLQMQRGHLCPSAQWVLTYKHFRPLHSTNTVILNFFLVPAPGNTQMILTETGDYKSVHLDR